MFRIVTISAICIIALTDKAQDLPSNRWHKETDKKYSAVGTLPLKTGTISPEAFTNCSDSTSVDTEAGKVRIRVDKAARYDSSFCLKLTEIPLDRSFHFTADTSSSRNMNGYLSVKLFRDGREIGRNESTYAVVRKKRLFVDFNTGNADQIELLCRVKQGRIDIGTEVSFENLIIEEGRHQNPEKTTQPRFTCVPGYENCSIYINHCTAVDSSEFFGRVKCRKKGDDGWKTAPPLVYIPDERTARSSIFRLNENTEYDLQITIVDAGENEIINGHFQTKTTKLPISKEIILGPTNFSGRLIPTESGTPNGYIRYSAEPGFILKGAEGLEDVIHLEDLHHIILDGLTIRGGKRFGITVSGSENISILNCDISQFGQEGTPVLSMGYKYCAEGETLRDIAGIRIVDSGRMLIERNFIHDTRGKTCPWFYSHPDGPFGILLYSTGDVTLRYNDIIGSDEFRWNDVIGGYYNGSEFGSFYRDASIYGNFLAFANDDGIELDGGQMNCRFYRNRVEGTLCGISTAPCLLGPTYIFENLFCNPGDEFQVANYALKNNFASYGKGQLQYFNNTIHGCWSGFSGYYSIPTKLDYPNELKALTRNNIFNITGNYYDTGAFSLQNDFNFNLFWNPDNLISASTLKNALSRGYDADSLTADPEFLDPAAGDFQLSSNSPAIRAGAPIPGLFEDKPNIGALQAELSQLPYRPSPLAASKNQLNFTYESKTHNQKIHIKVTGSQAEKFTIKQPVNNDFFLVSPSTGTAVPGRDAELSITLRPEHTPGAKVYSGAFLVCDARGYTRPVSVRADLRGNITKVHTSRRSVIYGQVSKMDKTGKCFIEFDVQSPGNYFLFGYMSQTPLDVMMKRAGDKASQRTRFYGITGSSQTTWHAISSALYTTVPYLPTHFTKGKHTLAITPYRGMPYKIERIALAAAPEEMLYSPFTE